MKKVNFEDFFLMALGDGKDDRMLRWYLENNINLVSYLDSSQPQIMGAIDFIFLLISKEKRKEMIGDTSSARILKIMEKKRSKLYSTLIKYPNGRGWVKANIENFKKRFL